VGNAIQGIGLSIYSLLFSLYLKELGLGESSIGNLISTTSLGISFMAIPAALIIEKFHVKHLVITGMFMSSLFYLFQIYQISESALFSLGLLASMFQALFNISVAPFYLRNSTSEVRLHLFTLNSSLNIIAHLIGYLIGGYLPELISTLMPQMSKIDVYRNSIFISLLIVLSSNLVFMQIKRVSIPKFKRNLFHGVRDKDWKILMKLTAPKLCFAFGGGLIVPFMNIYLKDKFDFSTKTIGICFASLQVFIFAGIFITPALLKKTTHLKFVMISAALSIPFMLTIGFAGNMALVLSSFFMRGMLMNMTGPITSMFEMEHVNEKDCVFASAILLFFYHMVYTFSTRLAGELIERYSFGPTFYIAAVFYALAIFSYYSFFKGDQQSGVENNRPQLITEEAA
jgi:MFS family permease